MKVLYDSEFILQLKETDVRIQKNFREKIAIFQNNPKDPLLDNHSLKREYVGYRSINITADYRAIFKQIPKDEDIIYYFFLIGTHEQLYSKKGP